MQLPQPGVHSFPSSLAAFYLPSPLQVGRALDVVEVQHQGPQGSKEPAKPQQGHHHHPSISKSPRPLQDSPPKLGCSKPTSELLPRWKQQVVCKRFL